MADQKSGKTTGYHLFFEPTGPLAEELNRIIKNLSKEYGGPTFVPHITLLAEIPDRGEKEIKENTKRLAAVLKPVSIELDDVDTQDEYFKAFYMRIRGKEEVEASHAKALHIFSMADEQAYLPHLSLLYGDYDSARKWKTITDLGVPKGASFLADKLHLYKTDGGVESWYKVATYAIGG